MNAARRKDVSAGFSADDEPTLTRAELRERKLQRIRASQVPDDTDNDETTAVPATVVTEPSAVIRREERLEFRVADADADPADQLRHYERTIGDAQTAVQAMLLAAHEQWILVAGQALREVRDGRLFTHAGHDTFEAYVQARWDMQRAHAYRLIDAVPVVRALTGTVRSELKERQMRALVPVGRQHGDQAVRDVWDEAERRGRTSGAGLEEVAAALGYIPASTPPADSAPRDSVAILRRAWSRLDAQTIREAAGQDPDEVRRIVTDVRSLLDEIEAHLPATAADFSRPEDALGS